MNRRQFLSGLTLFTAPIFLTKENGANQGSSRLLGQSEDIETNNNIYITGLVPQSGVILSANILKYFLAENLGFSFLNMANGQIQYSSGSGLSKYSRVSDPNRAEDKKLVCVPPNMVYAQKSSIKNSQVIVVQPVDLEYSFWSYLVAYNTRIVSVPMNSSALDFKPGKFKARRSDVELFHSIYTNNLKILNGLNKNQVKYITNMNVQNSCDLSSTIANLSECLNWQGFADFADKKIAPDMIYKEPQFLSHPSTYVKNKMQAAEWFESFFKVSSKIIQVG